MNVNNLKWCTDLWVGSEYIKEYGVSLLLQCRCQPKVNNDVTFYFATLKIFQNLFYFIIISFFYKDFTNPKT